MTCTYVILILSVDFRRIAIKTGLVAFYTLAANYPVPSIFSMIIDGHDL